MRVLPVLLVVSLMIASLPSNGEVLADPAEVYFREDFEDGAQGWWGDPGWRLSDRHTRSGDRALHFGDEDHGIMFCEETLCRLEVRSPVFTLPQSSPAHLYFWTFKDAGRWGTLHVDVEVLEGDDVKDREKVLRVDNGRDWVHHAEVSAYPGEEVRLVFLAEVFLPHEWEQGIFIDDVVVTDRWVQTESVHVSQEQGPSARALVEVAGRDRSIIEVRIEGELVLGHMGAALMIKKDGEPYAGFGMTSSGWTLLAIGGNLTDPEMYYRVGNDVSASLAGTRLLDEDLTIEALPDGRMALTSSLLTDRLEEGAWELIVTVFGWENTTSTVTVRTQTSTEAGATAGGASVAFDHPADLEADFFAGSRHGAYTLVGGRGSWTTDGPSLGLFLLDAMVQSGVQVESPEGPLEYGFQLTERPGEWSAHVDHAIQASDHGFAFAHISAVPETPDLMGLQAPPLHEIPFGGRSGEVRFPTHGERVWDLGGSIGCQVKVLGVGTDPSCGLFPLVWATPQTPLVSNAGLLGIDYRLQSQMNWLGTPPGQTIGDTCLEVTSHGFEARGCQTGERFETLVEGDPLLTEAERIFVELEKDETSAAFIEVSDIDLVFRYDLEQVPSPS